MTLIRADGMKVMSESGLGRELVRAGVDATELVMDADKARAVRRHERFGELWAFVGGRGPSRIKVPVNADTAGVLEGFWSLVNHRMKLPENGKVKQAQRRRSGRRSTLLST